MMHILMDGVAPILMGVLFILVIILLEKQLD